MGSTGPEPTVMTWTHQSPFGDRGREVYYKHSLQISEVCKQRKFALENRALEGLVALAHLAY